jgi:hypothetical protein
MGEPTGSGLRWRFWPAVLAGALWLAVAAALVACQTGVAVPVEDDPWGVGRLEGWPLDYRQAADIPRGINRYAVAINGGIFFLLAAATWVVLARWLRSERPWLFHVRSLLVLIAVVAGVMLVARLENGWYQSRMVSFREYRWFPDSWWKNALPTPMLSRGPWHIRLPLGAAIGCAIHSAGLLAAGLIRLIIRRSNGRNV